MERLRAVGRRLRGMFGRFVQWFRPEKGTSKRGQVSLSRIAAATMLLLFLFVGWRVWSAVQMLTPSDSLGADVASLSEGENVQNGANAAAVDAGGDRDRLNVPSPPVPETPQEARPPVGAAWVPPLLPERTIGPGWRRHGETAFWYYESALVLQAKEGTPIVAAAPGVVTAVAPAPGTGGGWNVTIAHDDGFETVYENVFRVEVAKGNAVSAHTRLGEVRAPSLRDGLTAAAGGEEARPSIAFNVVQHGEPVVEALVIFSSL